MNPPLRIEKNGRYYKYNGKYPDLELHEYEREDEPGLYLTIPTEKLPKDGVLVSPSK